MKMEYHPFVKTYMFAKHNVDGKQMVVRLPLRFNPFYITSYYGSAIKRDDGEEVRITKAYIASVDYAVDMSIEEFDKMMDNIETGVSFKED